MVSRAGTSASLDGRKAVPEKAKAAGYRFEFGGLPQALEEALRSR
jgi:NAD dependent epimerase/dehydratase family enzyme